MKISQKIVLLFIAGVTVFAAVCLSLVYVQSKQLIVQQEESKATLAIQTMATFINETTSIPALQSSIDKLKKTDSELVQFDLYSIDSNALTSVASSDKTRIGAQLKNGDDMTTARTNKMVSHVTSGNIVDIAVPMHDSSGKAIYVADVQFSLTNGLHTVSTLLLFILLAAVLLAGIVSVLMWALTLRILKRPLGRVILASNRVAGGNLDVDLSVDMARKDEMGELSASFMDMVTHLRMLIGKVSDTARQVAASAEQLTASSEETSKAGEHIVSAVQEIAAGSELQLGSVVTGQEVIQEVSDTIEKVTLSSENVSRVAAETAELATEGNHAVQTSVQQMQAISDTMSNLDGVVRGLGERSHDIGRIVEVIMAIAEQTNLLALNAAIESARAGEHGRGFAVVAGEVRKLAEQSSQSAQRIGEYIRLIQDDIQRAVESMQTGTSEVAAGIDVVGAVGTSFERIRTSVDAVASQIRAVSMDTQRIAQGTALTDAVNQIASLARANADGTQNAIAASEEQVATMGEITASATALTKMAEELVESVSHFEM